MRFLLLPLFLSLSLTGCETPGIDTSKLADGLYAVIKTPPGEILIRLTYQKAPLTVANFVGLAEGKIKNTFRPLGEPFFDGLTFHRVDPNFVIQGGDPLANGLGTPGYSFQNETSPELLHNLAGTVAMANSGPNTNGCQFYITLAPTPNLNGSYNVFGYVGQGLENVYKIAIGDPIESVRIIRKGPKAEAFDALAVFEEKTGTQGAP